MRKFKGHQRHSLPFCLFLAVVAALPLVTAPRANAEVDANSSWTGAVNTIWNNSSNWGVGACQAPAIPPSSTAHSVISRNLTTKIRYCRHSVDDNRCRSKRHDTLPTRQRRYNNSVTFIVSGT